MTGAYCGPILALGAHKFKPEVACLADEVAQQRGSAEEMAARRTNSGALGAHLGVCQFPLGLRVCAPKLGLGVPERRLAGWLERLCAAANWAPQ